MSSSRSLGGFIAVWSISASARSATARPRRRLCAGGARERTLWVRRSRTHFRLVLNEAFSHFAWRSPHSPHPGKIGPKALRQRFLTVRPNRMSAYPFTGDSAVFRGLPGTGQPSTVSGHLLTACRDRALGCWIRIRSRRFLSRAFQEKTHRRSTVLVRSSGLV